MQHFGLGVDSVYSDTLQLFKFSNLWVLEVNLEDDEYRLVARPGEIIVSPHKKKFEKMFNHFLCKYLSDEHRGDVLDDYSIFSIRQAYKNNKLNNSIPIIRKDVLGIEYIWLSVLCIPLEVIDEKLNKFYIAIKNVRRDDLVQKRHYTLMKELNANKKRNCIQIYEVNLTKNIYIVAKHIDNSSHHIQPIGSYSDLYKFLLENSIHKNDCHIFNKFLQIDNCLKFFRDGSNEFKFEVREKDENNDYHWFLYRGVRVENKKNEDVFIEIYVINIDDDKIGVEECQIEKDIVLRESFDEIYRTNLLSGEVNIIHSRSKNLSPQNGIVLHDEIINIMAKEYVHPYDEEVFLKNLLIDNIKNKLKNHEENYFEYRHKNYNGEYIWFSILLRKSERYSQDNSFVYLFIKDINEKKKVENLAVENQMLKQQMEYQKQLRISNSRYKIIVKQTGAAVFEWMRENNYYYASSSLPKYFRDAIITGKGLEAALSSDHVHNEDLQACNKFLNDCKTKNHLEITCRMLDDRDRYIWYKLSITNIFNEHGELERMVGTLIDVDEVTKAYETLKYRAEFDALTGAPNIQKFYSDARKVLREKGNYKCAILRFDIEKFKVVNDLYGRAEGDKILKYVTLVLKSYKSNSIIFGRMSGDVFCILIKYINENEIIDFINDLTHRISQYPLEYKTKVFFGIVKTEDSKVTISTMCDWAGLACQTIKGSSIKNYFFYDDKLRNQIVEEKNIEDDMYFALANKQFQVYLQPKYNIKTGEIIGAEALSRWIHPKKGFLSTGQFIPLFEKNGFIIHLDEYVWEEVCKLIRKWIDFGLEPIPISVNVSRVHIHNPNFYDVITKLCEKYSVPHNLIELEITESTFFGNVSKLFEVMLKLQKAGFVLSMDDFGSGYSSLNMLKNVPVDVVKIDREFFNETVTTERGKTVIRYTIAMAKQLNMEVIAEGVETLNQAEFLLESGCNIAQGYYYSKPICVKEFEEKNFNVG